MHVTDKNESIALNGLTEEEVKKSRETHGPNTLYLQPKRQLGKLLFEVAGEPMFLLLVLGCGLYFFLGDKTEAWLMAASILFVITIEIVQELRSEKALRALREYSQPKVTVIRNGFRVEIPSSDLVVGDLMVFSEGERLAADGRVVQYNDLSIDESVLTGESLPVNKTQAEGENQLYQGTVVASGQGVGVVTAVGHQTAFGKLGKSIESIESEPTPLQNQINRFVKLMMLIGLVAFVLVFIVNYLYVNSVVAALLFSLSFGLALIPEEIPVAFTTFMALGAYRMTRKNVLVKQPKTVESLGSATVICLDKTGTITENQMSVAEVVDVAGDGKVLEYAMWASEPEPFDAMEKAIHAAYGEQTMRDKRPDFQLFHEYPLSGKPPMMTHLHRNTTGDRVIATKGAVERIMRVCGLDHKKQEEIHDRVGKLTASGYRVLGVASAVWTDDEFPNEQDDFPWVFQGLVALFDPPKQNIHEVFKQFYRAGIQVKMITGDHAGTALNIARESGLRIGHAAPLTGEAVMNLPEDVLREKVGETVVFARMFPEAKLRVVEALKANGEVVAMTGDGVNDGPALKAAQIGVAMGRRGTEVAKGAASMVLLNDDLGGMVVAIENGRRIYANLRKAIRYIISIHIPIVLTVVLPLVFGWTYLHMLTPIHVIFLELIMDPTCAVAFENEPTEPQLMTNKPRKANSPLFTGNELLFSVLQGLILTAGVMGVYHYAIWKGASEAETRTFVFTTMLAGNIFLTFANRSFEHTIAKTFFYKNRNIPVIALITIALLAAVLFVPWVNGLFKLGQVSMSDIAICLLTALVSVAWFEVWKALTFRKSVKQVAEPKI